MLILYFSHLGDSTLRNKLLNLLQLLAQKIISFIFLHFAHCNTIWQRLGWSDFFVAMIYTQPGCKTHARSPFEMACGSQTIF